MDRLSRDLAQRLREVREDFHGEQGAQFLADDLGPPLKTRANDERGVSVPGLVVLKLVNLTGVNPRWLLTGKGREDTEPVSKGRQPD